MRIITLSFLSGLLALCVLVLGCGGGVESAPTQSAPEPESTTDSSAQLETIQKVEYTSYKDVEELKSLFWG